MSNLFESLTKQDIANILVKLVCSMPEPLKEDYDFYRERDRLANPHNESHKPHRRSQNELRADIKIEAALIIFERLNKIQIEKIIANLI